VAENKEISALLLLKTVKTTTRHFKVSVVYFTAQNLLLSSVDGWALIIEVE
jgi:hypothetical protein